MWGHTYTRKCVMTDYKNTLSSNVLPTPGSGKTYYDVLLQLVSDGNYLDYFDDGDYIELTCTNGDYYHMIIDVNPYKGWGNDVIGNHIDLISEHIIPDSNQGSYQMRTTSGNNGTSSIKYPWLASPNIVSKLNSYSAQIPATLKSHMINKRYLCAERYSSSSSTLTDDTGWSWTDYGATTGKLWLLHEVEVYGYGVWGSKGWAQGGARWYNSFRKFPELRLKRRSQTKTDRAHWWLADARSGNSTNFCNVNNNGNANNNDATNANIGVPIDS